MDNNSKKDELRVEHYDATAADMKKKKILKIIGAGIGVAVATTVLGYFGLVAMKNRTTPNKTSPTVTQNKPNPDTSQNRPPSQRPDNWRGPNVKGGSGAWYASVVVHLEDSHG